MNVKNFRTLIFIFVPQIITLSHVLLFAPSFQAAIMDEIKAH